MQKLFLLSWRKLWIAIVAGFASIILHNLISALLKTEEVFFFILVVFILPAYLIVALVYTLINKARRK